MAVAKNYGRLGLSLMSGEVNFGTHTFKLMLCTNLYTPDQGAHRYKSDITNEVSATGYTAGGTTLTGVALSYDAATNRAWYDANDPSWPTATITARWAVMYDSTPSTDATRPLIGYIDFGADTSSTTATFAVPFDPSGVGYIQAA